jgi:hypothetical protein
MTIRIDLAHLRLNCLVKMDSFHILETEMKWTPVVYVFHVNELPTSSRICTV